MHFNTAILLLLNFTFFACSSVSIDEQDARSKNASAIADFYDFEWSGVLETDNCWRPHMTIDQQLLYTVGQLNGNNSVGRLDQVAITNILWEETEYGCRITYDARMPVAWGDVQATPDTYEFVLPKKLDWDSVDAFVEKYTDICSKPTTSDVDSGVFWYFYRPNQSACQLDEAEVVRLTARLLPNADSTEGKYPEYDMVWSDDTLNVVAIFGKAEEESEGYDAGINAFWRFTNLVEEELYGQIEDMTIDGEGEGASVNIRARLSDNKKVNVYAFMIRSVAAAGDEFWSQYEQLTPTADYIVYNGHSGLGRNVRRLAREGAWQTGQYAIVFMNGCDTYAYIDSALADAHAEVNPDDPEGTRYLDVVANAMPSYVSATPEATMAIFRGLLSYDEPMTYEEILKNIDPREVALVTGEHDNTYQP